MPPLTPAPAGLEVLARVPLTAVPTITWPVLPDLPESVWVAALRVLRALAERTQPCHQSGGNPVPVQGSVEYAAAFEEWRRFPRWRRWVRRNGPSPKLGEWFLLAQVDTDDAVGMPWWYAGRLYFMIRSTELAARRFDRVYHVLQCD